MENAFLNKNIRFYKVPYSKSSNIIIDSNDNKNSTNITRTIPGIKIDINDNQKYDNQNSPTLIIEDEIKRYSNNLNSPNVIININDDEHNFNNIIEDYDSSNIFNQSILINEKKNKLLEFIKESKKKVNTSLYIISCKYDRICFKYNLISLLILILSTVITFIEALKLTIVSYINDNNIIITISSDEINMIINITELFLGTLLTILSSIIKFKNYRDIMEKLKNTQGLLFNYKCLYNKQKKIIIFYEISGNINNDVFNKIYNKIIDYNNEIKEINIFEDIRINDIIKFNKFKVKHDLKLDKLHKNKEIKELELLNDLKKKKYNLINKL